jgi:hypothetical protein
MKKSGILTVAHVVTNTRLLEIKKENDPKKYISHQADLAILDILA